MRPVGAYWGHFAAKNAEISTNGSTRSESRCLPAPQCVSSQSRIARGERLDGHVGRAAQTHFSTLRAQRQASAEQFQQCAEFLPLRNRGLGPLAVTVLSIPLARRAAAIWDTCRHSQRSGRAVKSIVLCDTFSLKRARKLLPSKPSNRSPNGFGVSNPEAPMISPMR